MSLLDLPIRQADLSMAREYDQSEIFTRFHDTSIFACILDL